MEFNKIKTFGNHLLTVSFKKVTIYSGNLNLRDALASSRVTVENTVTVYTPGGFHFDASYVRVGCVDRFVVVPIHQNGIRFKRIGIRVGGNQYIPTYNKPTDHMIMLTALDAVR